MKSSIFQKTFFFILSLFIFLCTSHSQSNSITLNGEAYYINGINLPWNNFGWDFGAHEVWGRGFDEDWFDSAFADISNHGVNSARIWIHCDGRANPNFDDAGYVSGLDPGFLGDLARMVELAEEHQIMLILTLWSHDMLEDYSQSAGPTGGLHKDIIVDSDKTQSYIDNALIPLVTHLNHHCNILAWEIINEPEWCINEGYGGSTHQVVSKEEMQDFVGSCVASIRDHSDQNITIGSAKPMGNADNQNPNYWHEDEFHRLGFDCSKVYFDFYSFHYYDYMGSGISPFENDASEWQLSRPILIAESPSTNKNNDSTPPAEQLQSCRDNNYAGVMLWSYNADDDFSSWDACNEALDEFGFSHSTETSYESVCDSIFTDPPLLVCSSYPNPTSDFLNLQILDDKALLLEGAIYSVTGQEEYKFRTTQAELQIDVNLLSSGIHYLRLAIFDEHKHLLQSRIEQIIITKD